MLLDSRPSQGRHDDLHLVRICDRPGQAVTSRLAAEPGLESLVPDDLPGLEVTKPVPESQDEHRLNVPSVDEQFPIERQLHPPIPDLASILSRDVWRWTCI